MKDSVQRNDRVTGLKASTKSEESGKIKLKLSFTGKFGNGYDGCGTHTHK